MSLNFVVFIIISMILISKNILTLKFKAAKMRSQSTPVYEYVYPLLLLVHQRFYIYLDERRKGDYTKRMQCGISHVEI